MIQTINQHMFIDAFMTSDSRKDQFSYGALKAIFAHLENYEDETGESVELDVVAICCEYSEYDNAFEARCAYDNSVDLLSDNVPDENKCREWLEERTMVLDAENITPELESISSIVIVQF